MPRHSPSLSLLSSLFSSHREAANKLLCSERASERSTSKESERRTILIIRLILLKDPRLMQKRRKERRISLCEEERERERETGCCVVTSSVTVAPESTHTEKRRENVEQEEERKYSRRRRIRENACSLTVSFRPIPCPFFHSLLHSFAVAFCQALYMSLLHEDAAVREERERFTQREADCLRRVCLTHCVSVCAFAIPEEPGARKQKKEGGGEKAIVTEYLL